MILHPLQNKAIKHLEWIQLRPTITQHFGVNKDAYKKFGLAGHNGIDLRAQVGTPVFAPVDGIVDVRNYGRKSYGRHIRIKNDRLLIILAHLNETLIKDGQFVRMGEMIGRTGNSGYSSGPHLHIGGYYLEEGRIVNIDNDFAGAINLEAGMITWKGTHTTHNL